MLFIDTSKYTLLVHTYIFIYTVYTSPRSMSSHTFSKINESNAPRPSLQLRCRRCCSSVSMSSWQPRVGVVAAAVVCRCRRRGRNPMSMLPSQPCDISLNATSSHGTPKRKNLHTNLPLLKILSSYLVARNISLAIYYILDID